MTAIVVSAVYSPPSSNRTPDWCFVVKDGDIVTVHKHSTQEAAVAERERILATASVAKGCATAVEHSQSNDAGGTP